LHSNAPIKDESQSYLSKIVAGGPKSWVPYHEFESPILSQLGRSLLYQRPQVLTVAQVLDVIEATRSGSSAKKRHAAQDLSTMSS
jgi:hypothetical protein